MGLGIGLLMVTALLYVILSNGLSVFWPNRIAEITLAPGSAARIGDSDRLAGEVRMRRVKRVPGRSEEITRELQFFVGNRDAYGFGFRFVDASDVAATAYPAGLAMITRLEYGPAIGYLVSLAAGEDAPVPADDPRFQGELQRLTREFADRRREIERIEKAAIGPLSARKEQLRLAARSAAWDGKDPDPAAAAAIAAEIAKIEDNYATLAEQAGALRALQAKAKLTYRLPTGAERTMVLGGVVDVFAPNRMGFGERCVRFAGNIKGFLTESPREANTEGGVFPAIFGTFVMTLLMSVAVVPFGVVAAIYLREYARQGPVVRAVRIAVNNLAGVPSIVFGVFGLGFFVYFVGGTLDSLLFADRLPTPTFGTGGVLWAALTLALMTVPVVIVATEEAVAAVPRGAREGSLACGASKWQTIQRIVLPAAVPGIITGMILAMARGAGEVAPLMLVGVVKLAPTLPLDTVAPFLHFDRKFMHLGFHIYDLGFQSPDSEAAKPMVFATTLLLILLVICLNMGAILLRERLRRRYQTAAF